MIEGDKPTELTFEYIDKFVKGLLNGGYDPKPRPCFNCSKQFFPNYDSMKCDECYFAQFPKEEVKAFYRTFF